MHSRRRSREFLLQSLYSRATRRGDFDREVFIDTYFSGDNRIDLERDYVDTLERAVIDHERELLGYIAHLAPKFDLETIPVMHILIIMIALSEILYGGSLDIPKVVSVNEAVELAKRFSDDGGREFVNGALSTFLRDQEAGKLSQKEIIFNIFA